MATGDAEDLGERRGREEDAIAPWIDAPLGAPLLAVLASVWVLSRPGPAARRVRGA